MKRLLKIILLFPTLLWAQSTFLPVEHPAYEFLERMDARGLLDHSLLGSKPVTRTRAAQLLDEVLEEVQEQTIRLSRVDEVTLAALRWEFARDAVRADRKVALAQHPDGHSRLGIINTWMDDKGWFTKAFYRNEINLYSLETEGFDAYFDPRGSARIISQQGEDEPIAITSVGVKFRGYINRQIGIHLEALDIAERGQGPYWDRSQLYEDRVGYVGRVEGDDSINYDVANFDLSIGGKFWQLHAAKTPVRWGPGRSGQLLLSDWGTSFHQLQVIFDMGSTLRLTYVLGALKTYPEIVDTLYENAGYYRTVETEKYIAAHRLEWDPHPRLRFGFSEAVVFGDRDPELAYLIPINVFYSAQHDLGDEDNTLISFDASWTAHPGYRLYGELLIDDITFGKLGSDYFGNKLGGLGGIFTVEPLGFENFDATLEMAQLRPFLYTHQYYVNVYKHYTAPLGYRYPPNSQTLFASLRYRPHRRVALEAAFTRLRHGANTTEMNAGGDIDSPHPNGASEDAPFLDGNLQKTNQFDLKADYEALISLHLFARGTWIDFEGEDTWEFEVGFRLN